MAVAGRRRRTEHVFFFGMASLLAVYVLLGFWKSYLGAGLMLAPLPSFLVHVHAILFVGWIALLLGQIPALISAGIWRFTAGLGRSWAGGRRRSSSSVP